MLKQLVIACALGCMAPVKKETEPVKASTPTLELVTKERDEARAEAAARSLEIAALKSELEVLLSANELLKGDIEELRRRLTDKPNSPSPALPVSPSADLPHGITEEQVRAKIAESAGQLRRADVIRILTRQRDRAAETAAAQAAAAKQAAA